MLVEVKPAEFEEATKEGLVLVDFYKDGCSNCKMTAIALKGIEAAMGDSLKIVKILCGPADADFIADHKIEGFPTLAVMVNGTEMTRKAGLQQKAGLIKMIEAYK